MKLRNWTIFLSVLIIIELAYFVINRGEISLLNEPFSTLGNMQGNYLFFLFATTFILAGFMIILRKMYRLTNTKIGWENYAFPAIVIITLLVPYKNEFLSRTIHTALGVVSALIMIWIIVKFNKNYAPKSKNVKKFSKYTPCIMFLGTLTLFLTIGLNSIMEIFYIIILLVWLNIVNYNLEKEVQSKRT